MQDWFDKYGESHQNPVNKAVHWICVPIIFVSIIGILSGLHVPTGFLKNSAIEPFLHGGSLLVVFGLVFYLRISLPMAVGMFLVSVLSLLIVGWVNVNLPNNAAWVYYIAFFLAWVGQFVGHKVEGAKPSFLDDLKFLMIGPAWLMGFIYRKLGIRY